jgi:4-hydroxymandelate oxidase
MSRERRPTAAFAPQELVGEPTRRITPLAEFVNITEFEPMAKRKLDAATFATVAGGDRSDFDRMTFRPRVMVDTTKLDLTTQLLGQTLFAPILIGPASLQQKIHPDGEMATVRGAAAAKAVVVISSHSSIPLEKIAAEAKTPLWYQVYPGPDVNSVHARAQEAVKLGCKALVITVGTPYETTSPESARAQALRWNVLDRLKQGIEVPVVLKGIATAEEAETAVKQGVQGIVVSNYGGRFARSKVSPMAALPSIAEAVGGKIAILADGGFRRGTDILKALILGANAVLLGRPVLWGLATYGAEGVQTVVEMAQSELARNFAMLGAVTPKDLQRNMLKVHERV